MRVFVAGSTGAIGRQLVPRLVAAGHEVHGMTRSESKQAMLHEPGAVPVVADALDADQVADAVGRARPDVIEGQPDDSRGLQNASLDGERRPSVSDRERLLHELRPVAFAIADRMLGRALAWCRQAVLDCRADRTAGLWRHAVARRGDRGVDVLQAVSWSAVTLRRDW